MLDLISLRFKLSPTVFVIIIHIRSIKVSHSVAELIQSHTTATPNSRYFISLGSKRCKKNASENTLRNKVTVSVLKRLVLVITKITERLQLV